MRDLCYDNEQLLWRSLLLPDGVYRRHPLKSKNEILIQVQISSVLEKFIAPRAI